MRSDNAASLSLTCLGDARSNAGIPAAISAKLGAPGLTHRPAPKYLYLTGSSPMQKFEGKRRQAETLTEGQGKPEADLSTAI